MSRNLNPKQTWRRVFKEVVSQFWYTKLWSGVSGEVQPPITVNGEVFGINIATSKDPACDDYVIARLKELELIHVRMNFSYESFGNHGERLLNKVTAEGFKVLLNLSPPIEDAASLADNDTAAQLWHDFVEQVFTIYKGKVAAFEIGNTSNRKKWSGFRPMSYLRAWQIASPIADEYKVRLAGPNVSDFEPMYNIAYLKEMQRLHRVPAIHTDNLFVERVIEPEAYDHRVFGRWAEKLLGLNLIKKARIIDEIGKRLDVEETYCTYNCWTVRRLSRRSRDPEQKQADYLTRYLVLAAVSGALDRVYWGALICNRDGMIDCGSDEYPDYENVSYYRQVRGQVSQFRIRPSFYAFQYAIKRLSNTQCIQGISSDNGINHFVLTSEKTEIHIVWCRDGYALPISNLYPSCIKQATYSSILGNAYEQKPSMITEQPLFIEFDSISSVFRPTVGEIKNMPSLEKQNYAVLTVFDYTSSFYNDDEWQGIYMHKLDLQSTQVLAEIVPEKFNSAPVDKVLRDSRNKVWNIHSTLGTLTVKLNRARGLKKLSYRFMESKGKRHWNNAISMLRRNVGTPMPVAYFERHQASGVRDNFYITQFLEGAFSARDVFASINNDETECQGVKHTDLLKIIGEFVCHMHNSGVLHRDLSSGNLLLREENREIKPYLIDIGRAQILHKLTKRQRLIDVMRICYKLPWSGREELMCYYHDYYGKIIRGWWLAVYFYEFKQKSKRVIKGNIKMAWKKLVDQFCYISKAG